MSTDGRDWHRYTRRSALGLMILGGAAVVSETLGFTNIAADRGVTLNFAEDDEAALGLEAEPDGGDRDPLDGGETVSFEASPVEVIFTNRLGDTIEAGDLEVEITNTTADTTLTVENTDEDDFVVEDEDDTDFQRELDGDDDASVTIETDGQVSDGGEVVVQVAAGDDNVEDIELEVIRARRTDDGAILTNIERELAIDGT